MLSPKLLLGLAAGGLGLFALTSSAKAGPAGGGSAINPTPAAGSAPPFPADLLEAANAALSSGDPAKMREVAAKMRARGYPAQATSLETAAAAVAATIAATPPVSSVPAGIVVPAATSPGLGLPSTSTVTDASKALAAKLSFNLSSVQKGKEDKALVTAYQTQEKARGFYVGNLDGLYGMKTALALAKDQKMVPPKPFYWPKNSMAQSKVQYRNEILKLAAADPARAEEWAAAAQV